jgi:hypothetical protein
MPLYLLRTPEGREFEHDSHGRLIDDPGETIAQDNERWLVLVFIDDVLDPYEAVLLVEPLH